MYIKYDFYNYVTEIQSHVFITQFWNTLKRNNSLKHETYQNHYF